MIFNKSSLVALAAVAAVAAAHETGSQHMHTVNISIQPAFHAIPIFAAKVFGWFEELGLEVNLSLYDSGAPQVQAAVENKAWDFGIAGSVPSVLAGSQGIYTIGINNDESATTEVFGAPGIDQWPPTTLNDGIFQATKDSTGELLLRKCLDAAGLSFDDNHIAYNSQSDMMDDLESNRAMYGSLWAPNTYVYEDGSTPEAERQVFCSGKDVDFPILGGLMVREEYGQENPDVVAKILAAYLRAVSFMQNNANHQASLDMSAQFHAFAEVPISEQGMEEDIFLRPLFNLDQQLDAMARNHANNYMSELDVHYTELEGFLFDHGVVSKENEPREYITSEFMELVSQDPELRAFAYAGSSSSSTYDSDTVTLSKADIVGIVVGALGALALIAALFVVCCCKKTQPPVANAPRHSLELEMKDDAEPAV